MSASKRPRVQAQPKIKARTVILANKDLLQVIFSFLDLVDLEQVRFVSAFFKRECTKVHLLRPLLLQLVLKNFHLRDAEFLHLKTLFKRFGGAYCLVCQLRVVDETEQCNWCGYIEDFQAEIRNAEVPMEMLHCAHASYVTFSGQQPSETCIELKGWLCL